MKQNELQHFFITKLNPYFSSEIGSDWVLVKGSCNIIDYASNIEELLIRSDLIGIDRKCISLYANAFTGDISEYLTEDYFNCKDRIIWVNQ